MLCLLNQYIIGVIVRNTQFMQMHGKSGGQGGVGGEGDYYKIAKGLNIVFPTYNEFFCLQHSFVALKAL